MTQFIQLHLLTSYPPSNLNRDDLGRPKTAIMGGLPRLRISSQSLKRAWRESSVMETAVHAEHIGIRTKRMGGYLLDALIEGVSLVQLLENETSKTSGLSKVREPVSIELAKAWSRLIAECFGDVEGKSKKETIDPRDKIKEEIQLKQLAHFNNAEIQALEKVLNQIANEKMEPSFSKEEAKERFLFHAHTAVDVAMFGRMLASAVAYNSEAAVQVAHAITVHPMEPDQDFFTAVDDLNKREDDAGAGHLGVSEFGAGLFYLYICIDKDLLIRNLNNNEELASRAIVALCEAAATVAPSGKQNSFASRARASYLLAEKGNQQPRSLSVAFLKRLTSDDILSQSIAAITQTKENFDKVYGPCADESRSMNVLTGEGNLSDVLKFITI